MNAATAKDYILGLITTLKLTEKEIRSLMEEAAKWKNRVELAVSKGADELLGEAERELEGINARLKELWEEERSLKAEIKDMRRQLPGLAARERSIDPDLLEQQLLMALWHSEEEAAADRAFRKLEKDSAVDSELEALKAKMNMNNKQGNDL